MAIEGPLRELGIQDVLQLLDLAHKTGVLTVRSERQNDEATVHFDRGQIVFARRRRSRRFLGQQLLRAGKLTERELERALELQRRNPSQRLSEILIEMGSVSEQELIEQLGFQIEETVYDVMGWEEGYFRFEERSDVFKSGLQIRVRVESLLMEGARRIDEWTQLESKIPSLDTVPVLAPHEESESIPLELKPEEWEVLAEIDGDRDIRQIAADLGRATFDVGKIVYGLLSTGVIRVQEKATRIPERELRARVAEVEGLLRTGHPDQAHNLVAQLQVAHPERVELALLGGRALAEQNRMRAATEAFDRAVSLDPLLPEAHYHLGFTAVRIGELERAAEAWSMFLRLSENGPNHERVQRALAAVKDLNEILGNATGA